MESIEKIGEFIEKDSAGVVRSNALTHKLETIRSSLISRKKGLRWRARRLIGERVKWYEQVEAGEGEA
jgi:hypothetical protein